MTYDLSIGEKEKIIYLTLEGPYTVSLIKNLLGSLVSRPDYDRSYNLLIHFKDVDFDPDIRDFAALSGHMDRVAMNYPSRLARVIHNSDLRDFYSNLVIQETENGFSSRIFSKVDDALAWLKS